MFAASTYEEIIAIENSVSHLEVVVFLFVKPTNQESLNIIKEFEYIHYNSAKYCSIYAIGYSDDCTKAQDREYRKVEFILDKDWYFSNKAFVKFKNKLEDRIKWEYSGEIEVLILQNSCGKADPLNFQNYVAIDVNKGLREGYIDSFQFFMESLIRSSRSKVTANDAINDICKSRISIKKVISDALKECKRIPVPVKTIITDRLFYKCANNMTQ